MTCAATRHGTATAYQVDGCRCPEAKEAQRLYRKRLRHDHHSGRVRKVDATGTRRRWQALMAIGWTNDSLMRRLGYATCGNWIAYADSVHVDTARRVKDLYNELWDQPGPSKWTRTWARNRGFRLPMAWDDDSIDDPLVFEEVENFTIEEESPCQEFIDTVVVERLVDGAKWREIGASRAERVAAAQILDLQYIREAAALTSAQLADPSLPRLKRNDIERHLGLRAGRDFAEKERPASNVTRATSA